MNSRRIIHRDRRWDLNPLFYLLSIGCVTITVSSLADDLSTPIYETSDNSARNDRPLCQALLDKSFRSVKLKDSFGVGAPKIDGRTWQFSLKQRQVGLNISQLAPGLFGMDFGQEFSERVSFSMKVILYQDSPVYFSPLLKLRLFY